MEQNKISLEGQFQFRLDPEDKGIKEQWFLEEFLSGTLRLPGTLCENGIGKELEIDLELNPVTVRSFRPKYEYIGRCWYQKKFNIPLSWEKKRVFLFLERIIIKSQVWVDDNLVGDRSSLVAAHNYDITDVIVPGKEHTLTILIDNRDTFYLSTYGHSYTNESQSIWNGIVGEISLCAKEQCLVEDLLVICEENHKSVLAKGTIKNHNGNGAVVNLDFAICSIKNKTQVGNLSCDIEITGASKEFECRIPIYGDITPWDEFHRDMYELSLILKESNAESEENLICQEKVNFGFRHMKVINRDILLNNKKVYLRGNLECCIHPLTGYPPCEVEYWIQLLEKVKKYGMNHLRFHSNCPPEAAFIAADQVGIYLQIEGPVWLDTWFMELGSHKEHYEFMPAEAKQILRNYSNHPSFCIFCNGNEFRGDFQLLHDIIEDARKIRHDILYTLSANYDRPLDVEDDLFISVEADHKAMRGNRRFKEMATTLKNQYEEAVAKRNIPLIAHEGGQYCVYPNTEEIKNYHGNLVPMNYMAIKNDLEKRNLLDMVPKFVQASGDFSARLYKEEIESYMRTKDFGGFQILGIQDFPGQCTATVGILDAFWNSKNLVTPEWFRQFCNDVVLLMKSEKRIYGSEEKFQADLMVNQFTDHDIKDAVIHYTMLNHRNEIIGEGKFQDISILSGTQRVVARIEDIDFSQCRVPTEVTIKVELENTNYYNCWNLWVYPSISTGMIDEKIENYGIKIATQWSDEVEMMLLQGERVLMIPKREAFINRPTYDSTFYPVFWSPVFFHKKNPCGIFIHGHEIFDEFVTGEYTNYQWYHLLEHGYHFDLDQLPSDFSPIIEAIPNYYYNHRMTNLMEAMVGKGVLMICSIQLEELRVHREANWLKHSMIEHLGKVDIHSLQSLSIEDAKGIFISKDVMDEDTQELQKENFID